MSGAPGEDAELRRMRWWDLPAVVALEQRLFPDDPWSTEVWWSELAGVPATRHYLVAADGEGVQGYAGLLLGPDTADVQTLAVAAEQQRRGTGRRLLRALLDEAARRSCPEVVLEVRSDALAARALYADEGFEHLAVRRGYYASGTVDALVLRRRTPARASPSRM